MQITSANEILTNKKFSQDKYKFHLFYKMTGINALFLSDKETYCLGRGMKGLPIWIWTNDNLSLETVKEVEELLKLHYLELEENKMTCKKELYDYLKRDFTGVKDYFEMGFLQCEKLNTIKLSPGHIDRPNYGDKTTLARFWYDNCQELDYNDKITFEEALETTEDFLNDENFYIWRNPEGKAVSMGYYTVTNNQAKVSHIYTPKEERCHGYCTSLVHSITKKILDDGLVALLYTNHNYEPSNKAYKKVGYEEKDILINFTIPKQEKNLCIKLEKKN